MVLRVTLALDSANAYLASVAGTVKRVATLITGVLTVQMSVFARTAVLAM